MAKSKGIVARIDGFNRTVGREKNPEGNGYVGEGEKLSVDAIELTREELEARLAVSVEQAAADAWLGDARAQLDTTKSAEENRAIFDAHVYGQDAANVRRASDLDAATVKGLRGMSAESLKTLGIVFIDDA